MNIQAEFTGRDVEVLMEMLLEKKYHMRRMADSLNIAISDMAWKRYRELDNIEKKLCPLREEET